MNWNRFFAEVFALLVVLSVGAVRLDAQTQTTGDIVGTVLDPSSSAVPGAAVTLKSIDRGTTQDTKTNKEGVYQFHLLSPGNYSITVSITGFQSSQSTLEVNLGQVINGDVHLTLGSSSTTVTVTEEAPLTQADDGNVSSTLNEKQVQEVPNSGNDLTFNAQLAAGSVSNTSSGLGNFSSFGISATANLFTLDGMDDNDPFLNLNFSGATNLMLGNNEVQEVSVTTNGYSGEYGTLAGANVAYVTKSGTNEWHGNATYYWNGRALNANSWFDNAGGAPRPFVNANQWGADLGGPIIKNKVFGYFDTEGLYLFIPAGGNTILIPSSQFAAATQSFINSKYGPASPTAAFYNKIFSLYSTTPGGPGTPVAGGGCDSSVADINAVAGTNFGAATPCANELTAVASNLTHDRLFAGRVDWNIGNNDRMFTRIQKGHGLQASITDPINPIFNAQSDQPEYQGQFQWSHTFNSNAVNQFIAAGQWYSATFDNVNRAATLAAFPTLLNFSNGSFQTLGGFFGLANNLPNGRNVTQAQLSDDFSKTVGAHTVKVGLKYRRNDVTDFDLGLDTAGVASPSNLGAFFFGGFDPGAVGGTSNLTQAFTKSTEFPVALYNLGGYVEDDWKVNSNLTVTLALRLEHDSNPICTTLCFAAPVTQFLSLDHDINVPYNQAIESGRKQALPYLTTIAPQPRFGFAYTPHMFGMHGETVIRGGIGIFYDAFPGLVVDNFAQNSPAFNIFSVNSSLATPNIAPGEVNNLFPLAAASNSAFLAGFSNGATFPELSASVPGFSPPGLFSASNRPVNPQYQKWSLGLERSFGPNMSLGVQYVGNHGIHEVFFDGGLNAAVPVSAQFPTGFAGLPLTPLDPRFGIVTQVLSSGVSNYNGVSLMFTRRWGSGVGQINYTYSHALDDVSNGGNPGVPFTNTGFGATNSSLFNPENPFIPREFNYGNADYDIRHYLSANYVWTVPIRRALHDHGWRPLTDGWQVSGTVFARSGLPFTPVDLSTSGVLGGFNYGGGSTIFATQLSSNNLYVTCPAGQPQQKICLNTADFSTSPTGFGNVTRNQLRGPNYFNSDFSLMKHTKIPHWERGELGFGAQFYNVFNHPNFQPPVGDASNSLFGSITRTVTPPTTIFGSVLGADASPRLIQAKLQFSF
jgi:Carboxypeptidase regulatory-like domain